MQGLPVKTKLPATRKSLAPTWHRVPLIRSVETGTLLPRLLEPHRAILPLMPVSIEFALKPANAFSMHISHWLFLEFMVGIAPSPWWLYRAFRQNEKSISLRRSSIPISSATCHAYSRLYVQYSSGAQALQKDLSANSERPQKFPSTNSMVPCCVPARF